MKSEKQKLLQKQVILKREMAAIEGKLHEIAQVASGDLPAPDQARRMKNQKFSYGVWFNRRKALRRVRTPGLTCKSTRRFTNLKEAHQHAKRFMKKHKHTGFDIVRTNKRANAWINWVTGKTNPVI